MTYVDSSRGEKQTVGPQDDEKPTIGSMSGSPLPRPRYAQEQTLGAMSGPDQDIYGPVPVYPIGQGWSPDATQGVRQPSSTQSPYGHPSTPSLNNEEPVLVHSNQVSTETSEFGSSVGTLTRNGHVFCRGASRA